MSIMNYGEKHVACALVVDVSGSMSGDPIAELNEGLKAFGEALKEDSMAYGCVDVCVIAFDHSVKTVVPFTSAAEYSAPNLTAGSTTAMNEAIITALDAIEMRKQEYKNIGVDYWRPWMFLLTDGIPTDGTYEPAAKQRLQEALQNKKLTFFPMGIGSRCNINHLKSYTKDGNGYVLKAEKNHFKEAFSWLSSSLVTVSNSNANTQAADLPEMPKTIRIEL